MHLERCTRVMLQFAVVSSLAVPPVIAQKVVVDNLQVLKLGAASGINAGKVTRSGELVAISVRDRRIFWMQEGKPARSSPIQGMPEEHSALRSPDLMADLAVDLPGRVFVPAVWHEAAGVHGKKFVSGLFVYGPSGAFSHTIRLDSPVAVRRVAIDGSGNLYIAGLDGDYFRGLASTCHLVHKYSPGGRRLASFSPCPGSGRAGSVQDRMRGFSSLSKEIDQSHLWWHGGKLFFALPVSRTLRIYEDKGGPPSEVTFAPPNDEDVVVNQPFALPVPVSERQLFRIFPLTDSRWLVYWLAVAGPYRRGYLAVHASDGSAVSKATVMPQAGPVAFSDLGQIFFVRPATGGPSGLELVRATVAVR